MMTSPIIRRPAGGAAIAAMTISATVILILAGCGGGKESAETAARAVELAADQEARSAEAQSDTASQTPTAEIVNACEEDGGEEDKLFMPWEYAGKEIKMKVWKDGDTLFATFDVNGTEKTVHLRGIFKAEYHDAYLFFDNFAYRSIGGACNNGDEKNASFGLYMWHPGSGETKYVGSINTGCYDGEIVVDDVKISGGMEYVLVRRYLEQGSAPAPFFHEVVIWRTSDWERMSIRVEETKESGFGNTVINMQENTIEYSLCPSPEAVTKFCGKYEIDESGYVEEPNPGESSYFGPPDFYEVCDMNFVTGAIKKVRGVWRYSQ